MAGNTIGSASNTVDGTRFGTADRERFEAELELKMRDWDAQAEAAQARYKISPERSLLRIADALETIADELRRRPMEAPTGETQAAAGVDLPGSETEQGPAGDAAGGGDRATQAEGADE